MDLCGMLNTAAIVWVILNFNVPLEQTPLGRLPQTITQPKGVFLLEDKMYPRTNYELTEEELSILLEAGKPTRVMAIGGSFPSTPQENANRAWQSLGLKKGFDYLTVQPIQGKGHRFFSAVPSETEVQKEERLTKEAEEKELANIQRLKSEIKDRQDELDELLKNKE